jgi:hypothetical protein
VTSAINRYYDPTTDQFLSIDPDVAITDQPYVFTNDDPLNAEDPIGMDPNRGELETVSATPKTVKIDSPDTFAVALLTAIHAPRSTSNVSVIVAWEAEEGGNWHNPDTFNPLDSTQPLGGSHATNSVGVQAYSSWSVGLRATVETLENGYYSNVLQALDEGNNALKVEEAVVASPWGTGPFASLIGEKYDP